MGKKYLNEKNYQRNVRKRKLLAALVLIIGLLIGGGLIATGILKYQQAQLTAEEISNIQAEIDAYNMQLSSLQAQRSQEFFSNGHSEKYYNLGNEIDKTWDKIGELEDSLNPDTSWLVVFYMFGGFIIFVTFMTSTNIYRSARGRDIMAFYAQQQIPLVKEGMEEMAPTMGSAAREIYKGKFRGIKEGLLDTGVTYCKHCGAQIDSDSNFCNRCGKQQ